MSGKKPFYYKRNPAAWLVGTMSLTAEERGVYDTIIDMIYDKGGPIKDDKELARICGCSSQRRYRSVMDRLNALGKITRIDGMITNARCERELLEMRKTLPELFEKTEKVLQAGSSDINGLDDEIAPQLELEDRDKNKNTTTRPRRARARKPSIETAIDENWKPSPTDESYASEKGFAADKIADMAESFRDHHLKKGTLWSDWAAAWRIWVRNEIKFNSRDRGGLHGGPTSSSASSGPRQRAPGLDPVAAAAAKAFGVGGRNRAASASAASVRSAGRLPDDERGADRGEAASGTLDLVAGPDGSFGRHSR